MKLPVTRLLEVLMLCQRGADRYHLKGRVLNDVELLVSVHGDEIVYRPDRYTILAVVYGRFRAL